jgi:hypothetical protein
MMLAAMVALLLLLVASYAGAASSATTVLRGCRTVSAAGKSWQVAAAGFPCADARALVRKFAGKVPRSGVAHVGNYKGMRCTGLATNGKRAITCAGTDGRLVYAQTRP